ncbi:MAG: hypothetical protein AAGJ38_07260 [Planctomycetota bacterium]
MTETHLIILRLVYAANVLVAGWVGLTSLLSPSNAMSVVFTGAVSGDGSVLAVRLVGCLWTAIAVMSAMGLVWPTGMAAVLLVQLIYKGLWLAVVAGPLVWRGETDRLPWGMTGFFAVWVVALPWIIPWRALLRA